MSNNLLSVLIPTYNRADFLDYSLEIHIPLLEKHNIQIIVFDNASIDNTQEIVSKWSQKYPHLIYYKHEENIGGIGNFEYALQHPSTEYVWMLGDTYQIEPGVIEKILNILQTSIQKPDVIVLNLSNKLMLSSTTYNDSNKLLNELGALITCIAVSIFKKDMIKEDVLIRYRDLWFTHMAIIFESISNRNFQIHWIQEYSVTLLAHPTLKKTNWSHTPKAFDIGCEDWTNFVMSLPPSYKMKNKMQCIMDFGKVSGLFTLRNLILLRMKGLLNFEVFNKYKKFFPLTIDYPLFVIFTIAVMPRMILNTTRNLAVAVRKHSKGKK
jgi:glycosyltransferase involved in cell wall biosynthesis